MQLKMATLSTEMAKAISSTILVGELLTHSRGHRLPDPGGRFPGDGELLPQRRLTTSLPKNNGRTVSPRYPDPSLVHTVRAQDKPVEHLFRFVPFSVFASPGKGILRIIDYWCLMLDACSVVRA